MTTNASQSGCHLLGNVLLMALKILMLILISIRLALSGLINALFALILPPSVLISSPYVPPSRKY